MTTSPRLGVAVILAVAIVFGFLAKHDADARRDGLRQELTRQITRDSLVVDSLKRRTDSLSSASAAAATVFTRRDTLWRRHSDTVSQTVTQIVTSVVPDSTKVQELAALIIETQHRADDAIAAAEAMVKTSVDFRLSVIAERAGWETQRSDMATKIKLLERQSRHFGLGLGVGYGATRISDGTIRAGPVLMAGVVYRW